MSDTDSSATGRGSEFSAGLGPLPEPAHFARVGDCEYRDCWNAQQVRAYALAEVSRAVAPLLAELQRVKAYIDETPDLFEALGPIECGPNAEVTGAPLGVAAAR